MSDVPKMATPVEMKPLRKCRVCGLEAWTEEDLEKFMKRKNLPHDRRTICKRCFNTQYQKGGKYHETVTNYRRKSLKKRREYNMRLINFDGKLIYLEESPRSNVCLLCNKRYPNELEQQTSMHHWYYDSENVLIGTQELCTSCHLSLPRTRWVEPCKGEDCTIVRYDANLFKKCPKCGTLNPIWNENIYREHLRNLPKKLKTFLDELSYTEGNQKVKNCED